MLSALSAIFLGSQHAYSRLFVSFGLRRVLNGYWLVAEDTVLVSMSSDLILEAFGVEHVRWVTVQTADVITAPDSLEADRTVEVFTFLEEKCAVRPPAELNYDPGVLTRVALNVSEHVER